MLGVRIGTTIEPDEVVDAEYTETLLREFSSVTPENAFKWYSIQPTEGAFAYASADTVLEFATTHHLSFRAHTLVWAQDTYTPTWVRDIADPVDLRAAVVSHITAVMSRYADRADRWDVVNEPLATFGSDPSESVMWAMGPDWIGDMFRLAHTLDADAELWLNEYGSDWVPGKHEALVELVRSLIDDGVPIDGVGIQTHRVPGVPLDAMRFAGQLRDFTDLGLEVALTELDVPVSPTDPSAFSWQASEYRSAVAACLAVQGCTEITTWGLTDRSTWLDSLDLFPTPTRPLLFDDDAVPKPAYEAVRSLLAATVIARRSVEPGDGELPTTGPSGPVAPALLAALGLVAAGSIAVMSSRRHHNRNAGKDTHRNKRVGSATSAVGARAATVSEIPFPGASQR